MAVPLAGTAADGVVPQTVARRHLFFGLFLLACANAMAGAALRRIESDGWTTALFELLGFSAVVWIALVAALAILADDRSHEPPRRGDWLVALGVFAITASPVSTASKVLLTLLALYAIATGDVSSAVRRAGIIFLALTGTLIWGPLLLGVFSGPLLDADAWLSAQVVGSSRVDNRVAFADGSGYFFIAPGCSSVRGMSLAVLFWATVNQWFRVPFTWRALLWCGTAVGATVAINVLRIGAIGHFREHFAFLHHGGGAQAVIWASLAAVVAICLYGARREVFSRN